MKNYTKQEILKIILSVAKEYDEKLNDKHFKITYFYWYPYRLVRISKKSVPNRSITGRTSKENYRSH